MTTRSFKTALVRFTAFAVGVLGTSAAWIGRPCV
jgi:hypothetical protein